MEVSRRRQSKKSLQEDLPGCGVEQVRATHHFVDALLGIIHDHGQLVGMQAVASAQHEIAYLLAEILRNVSKNRVMEPDLRRADPHAPRGGGKLRGAELNSARSLRLQWHA